jgi:hypothetical protein
MTEPTISDKITILDTLLVGVSDGFNSDTPKSCVPLAIVATLLISELMDLGKEMFTDAEIEMIDNARMFLIAVTERLEEQTDG